MTRQKPVQLAKMMMDAQVCMPQMHILLLFTLKRERGDSLQAANLKGVNLLYLLEKEALHSR
jgi:hypothetical protein